MEIFKIYTTLITERQAQACVKKFGYRLFDPQLASGEEENTKLEDEYVSQIEKFSRISHGNRLNSEMIKIANDLRSCMSSYPEILYPEGMAYRGVVRPLSDIIKLYQKQQKNPFLMQYQPKSYIQSWTSDKEIAKDFADIEIRGEYLQTILNQFYHIKEKSPKDMPEFILKIKNISNDIKIPLIMSLETNPKNFLFKSEYFTNLSAHPYEHELLGIGDKPINVIGQIHPRIFNLMKPLMDMIINSENVSQS